MTFSIEVTLTNKDDKFLLPAFTPFSYKVNGRNGNDVIKTGKGRDRLNGENGDDILFGGGGGDVLFGDNGNDVLFGDSGDDELYGGNGRDFLIGGTGKDSLSGGWGPDVFVFCTPEIDESISKKKPIIDVIQDFQDGVDLLAIKDSRFDLNNFSVTWGGKHGDIASFDFGKNGSIDFRLQFKGGPFHIDASDIYTGLIPKPPSDEHPDEAPDLVVETSFSGDFVNLLSFDKDGLSPFAFETGFVAEPVVGSTVTQSIVVTNTGTAAATDVLVTANFIHPFLSFSGLSGSGFINLDDDGDPLTGDGDPLTGEFLITNLAPNASQTINVVLQVNNNYNIFALTESFTLETGTGDYNGVTFSGTTYTDAVAFTKDAGSTEITFNPFPTLVSTVTAEGSGDTASVEGALTFLRSVLSGQLNNGSTAEFKSPYAQIFDLDPRRTTTYKVNNDSDLIGVGEEGIADVNLAFDLRNVDPAKLEAFSRVDGSNSLAPNGAISLFREMIQDGTMAADAFVPEFKGSQSSVVINTFDGATGTPVQTATFALTTANIQNFVPVPDLISYRFELQDKRLIVRSLEDGNVIATAAAKQNGQAPDVFPFSIYAIDSVDKKHFVDRTYVDQGEGIGIRDGDDNKPANFKVIDGDEILGISWVNIDAARAFVDVQKVSSVDGATIKIDAFNEGTLVSSQTFDLGLGVTSSTLSLFSTTGFFDEVQISAADNDTQFSFRGLTIAALPV